MVIMAITYLAVTPLALMGTTMLLMFTTMPPLVITLHVRDHCPATPGHPPRYHFGSANNKNERARTFHAWNWALSTY